MLLSTLAVLVPVTIVCEVPELDDYEFEVYYDYGYYHHHDDCWWYDCDDEWFFDFDWWW
jgi:hypothetical protein